MKRNPTAIHRSSSQHTNQLIHDERMPKCRNKGQKQIVFKMPPPTGVKKNDVAKKCLYAMIQTNKYFTFLLFFLYVKSFTSRYCSFKLVFCSSFTHFTLFRDASALHFRYKKYNNSLPVARRFHFTVHYWFLLLIITCFATARVYVCLCVSIFVIQQL